MVGLLLLLLLVRIKFQSECEGFTRAGSYLQAKLLLILSFIVGERNYCIGSYNHIWETKQGE